MHRTSFVVPVVLALAVAAVGSPVASDEPTFQVVVNPEIEGSVISRQTLSSIFLKQVKRWGSGLPVQPVDRSMSSGLRAAFTEQIMSRPFDGIRFYWADMIRKGIAPPPVKESDAEVIEYVAETRGAIGYVSLGAAVPDTVRTLSVTD